jgi:hypothetical protein
VKGGDDGGDGLIFCLHRMDKVGEGEGGSGKCSYNRFKYSACIFLRNSDLSPK